MKRFYHSYWPWNMKDQHLLTPSSQAFFELNTMFCSFSIPGCSLRLMVNTDTELTLSDFVIATFPFRAEWEYSNVEL